MPIVETLLDRISSLPLPFVGQKTGVESEDGFADFLREEIDVDRNGPLDRRDFNHIRDDDGQQDFRDDRADEDDIEVPRQEISRIPLSVIGGIRDIVAELAAPNRDRLWPDTHELLTEVCRVGAG